MTKRRYKDFKTEQRAINFAAMIAYKKGFCKVRERPVRTKRGIRYRVSWVRC